MKKYILIVKSLNYSMVQKFLGYHYSVIHKKLHKHSHWDTQETFTVTQETLNWRYNNNKQQKKNQEKSWALEVPSIQRFLGHCQRFLGTPMAMFM